jgi:hypothetical protein
VSGAACRGEFVFYETLENGQAVEGGQFAEPDASGNWSGVQFVPLDAPPGTDWKIAAYCHADAERVLFSYLPRSFTITATTSTTTPTTMPVTPSTAKPTTTTAVSSAPEPVGATPVYTG